MIHRPAHPVAAVHRAVHQAVRPARPHPLRHRPVRLRRPARPGWRMPTITAWTALVLIRPTVRCRIDWRSTPKTARPMPRYVRKSLHGWTLRFGRKAISFGIKRVDAHLPVAGLAVASVVLGAAAMALSIPARLWRGDPSKTSAPGHRTDMNFS